MLNVIPAIRVSFRVLGITLVSVALLLHAANLFLILTETLTDPSISFFRNPLTDSIFRQIPWGVGFAVMSLAILIRSGSRYESLIAGLFLGSYALWGAFLQSLVFERTGIVIFTAQVLHVLTHVVGLRFTQVFPRAATPKAVTAVGYGWFTATIGRVLAQFVRGRFFWPIAFAFEISLYVLPLPAIAASLHLLLILLLGVFYLYVNYRTGDVSDKKRIFWILEGLLVFLLSELLIIVINLLASQQLIIPVNEGVYHWIRAGTAWLTFGCFAMAIFFAGALDSRLVIKKTTAIGIAAGLSLVIFVALENLAADTLATVFGLESAGSGMITGIVAALFLKPLTSRIERTIDRMRSNAS